MQFKLNNLLPIIEEICREKNLSKEMVLKAIESALATAYRKDFGNKQQNIKVNLDLNTGEIEVFDVKTVVDDSLFDSKKEGKRFNPKKEITLSEAKKIKKDAQVGEEIKIPLPLPTGFGRVAAQAAKQVITQKLREAEKEVIYQEFKEKEGKIVSGIIQRRERGKVLIDLGKVSAVLPSSHQIKKEEYLPGQRIKVYVLEVKQVPGGPEVIVSRTHPEIIRELFKLEIPEVANNIVEIKAIAREAGVRSKVAVESKEKGVDPVGTCIGTRGSRIQTIIAEIGGEKIDIIEYSDDLTKFISNALSPAKVSSVEIVDEKKKIAKVKVKPDQFSLALGKGGQNIKLASILTGWKIEIEKEENK
jgi:N utilization substance protein A